MKTAQFIEKTAIYDLLKKGQFFRMVYVKADGTLRTVNAKLGVKNPRNANRPNGTGITAKQQLQNYGNLNHYDMALGTYRNAKIDNIKLIEFNNTQYIVI